MKATNKLHQQYCEYTLSLSCEWKTKGHKNAKRDTSVSSYTIKKSFPNMKAIVSKNNFKTIVLKVEVLPNNFIELMSETM